ncbi:ferric uptake regulation protein [Ligilactobacillus salitolerans]|uniref:Ferric uptake regulation protein n=2 Tax=Ligilactobacillus salitolerans TaxID=1808352 RepID=A0A401ITH9_9LACO|nr:ferric uptake regulation protein [Ligilactobacillus salitolerans]
MDTNDEMIKIQNCMHDAGFKLTFQRQAIVKVLLDHHQEHLSAEEIYIELLKQSFSFGLATVYRTLDILTEMNLLTRVSFEDGIARYDLRTEDRRHFHHHLICTQCGKTVEIHQDLLIDVEKLVAHQYHFEVSDHRLTFLGLCADCQRKKALGDVSHR